jgi:hypothetical protein
VGSRAAHSETDVVETKVYGTQKAAEDVKSVEDAASLCRWEDDGGAVRGGG